MYSTNDECQVPDRCPRVCFRWLVSDKSLGTSHLRIDLWAGHRQLGSGDRKRDRYGQGRREGHLGPDDHQLHWRVLGRAPDSGRL